MNVFMHGVVILGLAAMGMAGLYYKVEHSGWLLFFAFLAIVTVSSESKNGD